MATEKDIVRMAKAMGARKALSPRKQAAANLVTALEAAIHKVQSQHEFSLSDAGKFASLILDMGDKNLLAFDNALYNIARHPQNKTPMLPSMEKFLLQTLNKMLSSARQQAGS